MPACGEQLSSFEKRAAGTYEHTSTRPLEIHPNISRSSAYSGLVWTSIAIISLDLSLPSLACGLHRLLDNYDIASIIS